MDLGLRGKVALVTAASKGLGRASAHALAREGARLVICARGEEALEKARAELAALTDVVAVVGDVTRPEVPKRLVDTAIDRFGGLDVLVGNAGGPPAMRALEVDDASLTAALNANLLTSIRLVQAAVPPMRAAGWGRIVLIASTSVKQPLPNLALSNAARAGLWGWAKTAAQDLFADGITLNLALPGYHATDRVVAVGTPEGVPLGDPADFGKVVAFLCSDPARFVSGSAIAVDGARILGLS
ncbi:MAG: 3-oxoacyl-[acyl-carrier protein] reductase [Actinomycetota bacterium]|jgi:3-oxoacyl-[acyl-carrier protein] reductase|nr:3-oxoacyl-[acyl-carrier protein] reductase [Actinomycetota bacterium]